MRPGSLNAPAIRSYVGLEMSSPRPIPRALLITFVTTMAGACGARTAGEPDRLNTIADSGGVDAPTSVDAAPGVLPTVPDDPASIARACGADPGPRYVATSPEELSALLQGRWFPCDRTGVDAFEIEGSLWRAARGGDFGTVLVSRTPSAGGGYMNVALSLDDGRTTTIWAVFAQDRLRLVLGPSPVESSEEYHFVRVAPRSGG